MTLYDESNSHVNVRVERFWKGTVALILAAAILIGGLLALAVPAAAVVTPGATTPLVNLGQRLRDGSTAVPIFGITAASTAPTDQLLAISVTFGGTGFSPGNGGDLRALSTNPALSGVALYRDVGAVPGSLDGSDVGVTATAAIWTGSQVGLTYAESFPTVPAGAFNWILTIRTSSNAASLGNNDQIVATIPASGIVFSGGVTQPLVFVSANVLTVSLTSTTDLIAPQAWIGPLVEAVNVRAVLGIRIVDGGIPTNVGIDDRLTLVIVHVFDISGTYAGNSLRAPNVDPALSGIGLYRDTNGDGVWDPADTRVMLSSISIDCVPPADVEDWCLFPNAEPVPNTAAAGYSYFVVVRSDAMASGDEFQFQVLPDEILASGVHANDANRQTLLDSVPSSSLLGDDTAPCVTTGCGQPFGILWSDPTTSPYLFPVGRTLYFGHGMGTTPVPGDAVLSASDGESGLGQALFTNEPTLAGSPAPVALSGSGVDVTIRASYLFNAASTAESSPAFVTVYDAVGNHVTAPSLSYVLDMVNPLVVPAPGWRNLPGPEFFVNGTGTLWFSPWIAGTQTVDIRVDLSDSTSGLRDANATAEPSLAGGPFYQDPTNLNGVGTFTGWTVSYDFNAASTDASSPATITACDDVANCASASFDYRLDSTLPSVSILGPAMGAVLYGRIIVAATGSDAGSGVDGALQVMVLGQTGFMDMVWNGTAWVWPIYTALYPDGPHRIVFRALDNVGNEGVAVVDVIFLNRADNVAPTIALGSPSSDRGAIVLRATVSDSAAGVASVVFVVDGTTYIPVADGQGGYSLTIWTTAADDGMHSYQVVATDKAGNTATSSGEFLVNTPTDYYAAILAFAPLGILLFLVVALLIGLVMRRRGGGAGHVGTKPEAAWEPEPPKDNL